MIGYEIRNIVCPNCAQVHASTTGVSEGSSPEDGSFCICLTCSEVSIYDSAFSGGLRLLNDDERVAAMQERDVLKALWNVRQSVRFVPNRWVRPTG